MNSQNESKYLTVTALNRYIAYKLDSDIALRTIYIKGEISNARLSKGHLYFVLKDEESEISALIFSSTVSRLSFSPKDGMKVLIAGTVQSYPKKGTYNLIVSKIDEYGQGLIYQRFLELKEKLEKQGLFDVSHKKPIPEYPLNIGVITSDTGDAINDIVSTIQKRFPLAQVYLYKALVQGSLAPKSLIKALKKANEDNLCDVIIIGRGGGSIEDLDCFNDEELALTIYNSHIPVVSGVGHEADYTICDFVSDERAPTPTGAAVRVTKDKNIIFESLKTINNNLRNLIVNCLRSKFNEYNHLEVMLKAHSPQSYINNLEVEVTNLTKRLELFNLPVKLDELINDINKQRNKLDTLLNQKLKDSENKFVNTLDKLILVNPLNIMKKGYAVVYKDTKVVSSVTDIKSNDIIDVHFYDGNVKAKIE